MWERVDIATKVLDQIGVKKGDIILSMVPNIPEEEELWFGASQLGAITDYIDPRPDSMDPVANSKKLLEIIKYEKPRIVLLDVIRNCLEYSPYAYSETKRVARAFRSCSAVWTSQ